MLFFSRGFLLRLCLLEGRPNDRHKFTRVQAVSADESAIDIGLREECGRIVRLYAATILDAKDAGRFRTEELAEAVPYLRVRILGLLQGSVLSSATDGADRFVPDTHASQGILWNIISPRLSCRSSTASVCPALRSSRVSPTQKKTSRPASSADSASLVRGLSG